MRTDPDDGTFCYMGVFDVKDQKFHKYIVDFKKLWDYDDAMNWLKNNTTHDLSNVSFSLWPIEVEFHNPVEV